MKNAIVTQQVGLQGVFLQRNAAFISKQAAKYATCPDIAVLDWKPETACLSLIFRAGSDPKYMAPSIRKMGRPAFDSPS